MFNKKEKELLISGLNYLFEEVKTELFKEDDGNKIFKLAQIEDLRQKIKSL